MSDYDEPALRVGAVLKERYELRRVVGEGGMGTVFEAFDRLLERRVAVKVLRPDLATNGSIVARFELEAKIASAFQHPNVATTFDVGAHESGARFLVMEFLEGISLAEAIARSGPLPDAAAVALVEPVARALAKAHQVGVIHRDVKPENIFLVAGEKPGECAPKLVDFGIARREQEGSLRLTATATIIGTPAYMPPEQARGSSEITPAVDQYALAVVLYELLSCAHPHAAPSTPALLARKLTEPPVDLRAVAPTVSESLATVVMRALESDPSARFADMNAFRDALVRAVPAIGAAVIPPANRTLITDARVDSDARTEVATPESAPRPAGSTPVTRISSLDDEPAPAETVTAREESDVRTPPAKRTRFNVTLAAGLVGATLLVLLGARGLRSTPRQIAVESSAVRFAQPDASASVVVELSVEPATASIKVNGVEVGRGHARVSSSIGETVEFALSAEGYVSRVEQHRVTTDERIERVLERIPVAQAPSAPLIAVDSGVQHRAVATPAPRGHRPLQLGRTGFVLDTEIHQR